MISWSQKKNKKTEKYGKGQYPSACINEHGQVVEAHEAIPHSGHLHYYTDRLYYNPEIFVHLVANQSFYQFL